MFERFLVESGRRARERAVAERVSDLRWQWRCACEGTALASFVYTASGVTKAVPQITNVELGPPVALTVRVRPGQSPSDFLAAAPSLALALNVGALHVVEISPRWLLRIVLLPDPFEAVSYRPTG